MLASRRPVRLVEDAPAQKRHAHGVEISRGDIHQRDERRAFGHLGPSVDDELAFPAKAHGQIAGGGCRHEVPSRRQAFVQPAEEQRPALGGGELSGDHRELGGQQARRVHAEVLAIEREEAAHHQTSTAQQDERQRDLRDDERAGPAPRTHAARARSTAFLEHVQHVGLRHLERRRQPEEQSGHHADEGEEREHAGVERERHPVPASRASTTAASNHRIPKIDSPSPTTPLSTASSRLSTRSCRTMRPRPAPSATRTPISR